MINLCKSCKKAETEDCYLYDFLLKIEEQEEREDKKIVFSLEVEECPEFEK